MSKSDIGIILNFLNLNDNATDDDLASSVTVAFNRLRDAGWEFRIESKPDEYATWELLAWNRFKYEISPESSRVFYVARKMSNKTLEAFIATVIEAHVMQMQII